MNHILRKIIPQRWIEIRCQNHTLAEIHAHQELSLEEKKKYISEEYKQKTGHDLDWEHPQRYSEKINVTKLLFPTPEKTMLADKYAVRDWISSIIGDEYLIPLLGVYSSFDEIDFDILPQKFVIKCNHDSGSVTLCDKSTKIDKKLLKLRYDYYLKRSLADLNFEMHYKDIKPLVLVEKYMGDNIKDYKFMCIGGKVYYCRVDCDRFTNHKRNIYDMNWVLQPFNEGEFYNTELPLKEPDNFSLMKDIAAKLCKGFNFVRVDLYEIDGHVYFGEMTFTSGNGMERIIPDEYDYKLGKLWTQL